MENNIGMKKALWLEDQFEDLIDYASRLARIDYLVDPVTSVSEALEKLKAETYDAFIFDLKILPGDDQKWKDLDESRRKAKPYFDPYLGFELLCYLNQARQENAPLWRKIHFDFARVIVFSVVSDKAVFEELESFGIPPNQMINKSNADLDTLEKAVEEMEKDRSEEEKTLNNKRMPNEPDSSG